MPQLALITSLYRPLAHLTTYAEAVTALWQAWRADERLALEFVFIHNDPQEEERRALAEVVARITALGLVAHVLETPREPLYASWNRGIAAAQAPYFGSWNVDDARSAGGLTAGYALLEGGAALVDMPYDLVNSAGRRRLPAPYDPQRITPKTGLGPFFLARKALWEQTGGFHPQFRIAGDFEWASRPLVRAAHYAASSSSGGAFYAHGGNLSGGHNPHEWLEFNLALAWRGCYDQLRPVEPQAMRALWEAWGQAGAELPPAVAEWLWGAGAAARHARYERERAQASWQRRIRLAGARRGWWPSLEHELATRHPLRALMG